MMHTFANGFSCRYPFSRPSSVLFSYEYQKKNSLKTQKTDGFVPPHFSFGGVLFRKNTYVHLTIPIKKIALYGYMYAELR